MVKTYMVGKIMAVFYIESNPFENPLFYIKQGPKVKILNCPSLFLSIHVRILSAGQW